MANKKRVVTLALLICSCAGIVVFVLPLFVELPSGLNSRITDIDICSGRLRNVTLVLWMEINSEIKKTSISKEYRVSVGKLPPPNWKRVCECAIGGSVSPHFAYHHSSFAASQIDEAFSNASFSLDARRKIVHEFLGMLQADGNDHRAAEYASTIWKLSLEESVRDSVIGVDAIPSPTTKTSK